MRVSVVIDDNLMKAALEASGFKTKKQAIEEGLRLLIDAYQHKGMKVVHEKKKWMGQ
jgi:Arc/MetJ family transcription regulator